MNHIVHLVGALTDFPLNAIIVVVEYSDNGDQILDTFYQTTLPLYNKDCGDKVVTIISKFDRCDHYDK